MKTLLKKYDSICYEKYCSIGFAKCGASYVRMIADVVQAFTITIRSDFSCTINFGIFPLCMPTPIFFDAGGYDLNDLLTSPMMGSNGLRKDLTLSEQAEYINTLSILVDDYLLPIFNICNNCSSSLHELIRLEEQIDCNRREHLRTIGVRDSAIHWKYRSLFDSKKYYMALKAADWDYVRRYLHFHVDFCEKKLEDMSKAIYQRQPEIVLKRYAQKLANYKEHTERLRNGDFMFFMDMLDLNEKQMLTYIKARYPMLKEKT